MGRLEDVIARHAARKKMTSRKATLIIVGTVVVATILLMMFTDLGMPKAPPPKPPPPPTTRVDDVKLLTPSQAKRQIGDAQRAKAPAGANVQTTLPSPTH